MTPSVSSKAVEAAHAEISYPIGIVRSEDGGRSITRFALEAALPIIRAELLGEVRGKVDLLERVDPVVEEGGSIVTRAQGQGYSYATMEAAEDGEYIERAAVLSLLATLSDEGATEGECQRCGGDGEVEVEEMHGAQFVGVAKPCPDCEGPTDTTEGGSDAQH